MFDNISQVYDIIFFKADITFVGVSLNATDGKGGDDYGDGNTGRLVAVFVLGTLTMVVLISFVIWCLKKRRRRASSRSSEHIQLKPTSGSKQNSTSSTS